MGQVESDYAKSIEFLRHFRPAGPWVLTAIEVEQKGIETRTFYPKDEPAVLKWLEAQGQTRNIYFMANPPRRDLDKKANREDIAAMAWLYVDLDNRVGEDPLSEQARQLRVLQNPPTGVPPPTIIVRSGGGHWGFWKLATELPINGDLNAAEDAKRYNLQLEVLFTADNCHNIDRICRLPGTINRPDSKKRKKGRVEALAEVVEWHDDRSYDLSTFTKSPQVQTGTASGFVSSTVNISGNIKRLSSVDELPDKVSPRAKVVIVQGTDPNEPTKFPSRSEWLFYVCCEMVRGGCDDDTIFSVITDPAFGISSSVLDKGANYDRYAMRQIERAREDAIDPDLRRLNEKHAVIGNWGGRCRVVEEVDDPILKRCRLTKQSFDDFRNRYLATSKVVPTGNDGKTTVKPLGHWWLTHPHRRQFDALVFAPGKEVPGAYNLWQGFACEARPGDCSLFLEHLKVTLCKNDTLLYDYLMGWMARAVQQSDSPGYSAVVMRGGMGTGKSFVAKTLGSLFGRHYMQVTDPKHLVGSFNAHLRDCVILFGDEAFYAGDKKHESILKMLITEELITVEAKGLDAEASANCVHLMMASNEDWVVPAAVDDRRFFVLDISEDRKEDHAYFAAMQKQLDHGGREALLHHLMIYDLTNFNVRKVPKTAALREQQSQSLSGVEAAWLDCLVSGDLHGGAVIGDGEARLYSSEFIEWAKKQNLGGRVSANTLATLMRGPQGNHDRERRRPGMGFTKGQETVGGRRNYYVLPSLADCRRRWNEQRPPHQWPTGWEAESWGNAGQSSAWHHAA